MSRGRKPGDRAQRLTALLDAGDHGAARRLAAVVLADPASGGDERERAEEIRARTAPHRAVAVAGIAGAAAALAITAWVLAR